MKIRDIEKIFEKLEMKVRDNDDKIAIFWYKDKIIVRTKVSKGRGELPGKLPHFIRQQLKLNEDQFNKLARCTIYKDDYIKILGNKGLLP